MKKLSLSFILFCLYQLTFANVKLAPLFSDGMVLQRNIRNAVWGWADFNEQITVTWLDKTYTIKPDNTGKWMVYLDAAPAGGPYILTINGRNQIQIKDVLIGEVWICSGQSNMEWRMNMLNHKYDAEIAASTNPNIRHIKIINSQSLTPQTDVQTSGWKPANPENTPSFSAVGYFFAKDLYDKLHVPIGLVSSNWGGTVAQAWTSLEALQTFPNYLSEYDEWKKTAQPGEQNMDKLFADYQKALKTKDIGLKTWMKTNLNTASWKTMNQPSDWSKTELENVDGIVWLRKEVTIEKEDAGKDLILHLGPIDDNDITYFNGVKVGATDGYSLERNYKVKGGLVKPGKNVIAVRVVDTGGGGGLWGQEKPLELEINNKKIALNGSWQYKLSLNAKNPQSNASPNHPSLLFNGMIAPLIPYGIKGVIWYQGESNAGRAYEYRRLFPTMITDWRNRWQQGEFPFLFVQLANYMKVQSEPVDSEWAELREAQTMTLDLPVTGMACIIDIGEAGDIHPKNKLDVGKRLSYVARKVAYGEDIAHMGPLYFSYQTEGDKIRVNFTNLGKGLVAKNGELKGFAIAGADKKFYWAKARIEGDQVVVWSESVPNPVAVRYAWADNPEGCNLYNTADLPASPFRSDDWKGLTADK